MPKKSIPAIKIWGERHMGASISHVSRKCHDKWTIASEIQISSTNKLTGGQFYAFFPQMSGIKLHFLEFTRTRS